MFKLTWDVATGAIGVEILNEALDIRGVALTGTLVESPKR